MNSKKNRRLIFLIAIPCISILLSVFIFKERINDVYNNTIKQIPFGNIVFDHDSTSSALRLDSTKIDLLNNTTSIIPSENKMDSLPNLPFQSFEIKNRQEPVSNKTEVKRIGREIKAADLKKMHQYNSRIRLSTFSLQFKDGDFITGIELANIYRRDPTINKLSKSTICGFIEKNINKLLKNDDSFIIETKQVEGIHTKIKIPFVEDLRINIDNGAEIYIGKIFTSKEIIFNKSVLLPIKLEGINIIHNHEKFPISGYISGNYYFIDYSQSKIAYKLR
jgi:hypothetical protein